MSSLECQSSTTITTQWVKLDECLDSIAKKLMTENPMNGPMRRTLHRLLNNLTKEILDDYLSDYADIFKSNITLINIDDNEQIQDESIIKFGDEVKYQQHIFIFYNKRNQLFTYWASCCNGLTKMCFNDSEKENIYESIKYFIREWNAADRPSCNDNCWTITQILLARLQQLHELIPRLGNQLDQVPLNNESTQIDLKDFDNANFDKKLNVIINELSAISECIRMTSSCNYEDYTEMTASTEMEIDRSIHEPNEVLINVNESIISEQQNISESSNSTKKTIHYPAPTIVTQPARYQRTRMFSDLTSRRFCPLLQGGEDAAQQTYVTIRVPCKNDVNLYVAVRAVTVKRSKHPKKTVLPKNVPFADQADDSIGERARLRCDRNDFDPVEEFTYLLTNTDEHSSGTKEILVHLIKWKGIGGGNRDTDTNERLNICKLEFYFCIRIGEGQYEKVSLPSYSSVIEGADGRLTIPADTIPVIRKRDDAGISVELPLNVKCLKKDLHIRCNEELLPEKCFRIDKKQLIIDIPAKLQSTKGHLLEVVGKEYNDDIKNDEDVIIYQCVFNYSSQPQTFPSTTEN